MPTTPLLQQADERVRLHHGREPLPAVWGRHAEIVYGVHPDARGGTKPPPYTPVNKSLVTVPDRVIDGFTMFPEHQGKSVGAGAADRALRKLGLR